MALPDVLCLNAPISVKVTSSGDEGWECEQGDCVWYPLEGLPGPGLELPEEPAYRMTPAKHTASFRYHLINYAPLFNRVGIL